MLINPIRQLLVAAALALALSLTWLSTSALASPTHAHTHHVSVDRGHAHPPHRSQLPSLHVECEPSGIGCCMMALCHPALTLEPYSFTFIGAGGEAEVSADAEALGSMLDVAVPPPRVLPV